MVEAGQPSISPVGDLDRADVLGAETAEDIFFDNVYNISLINGVIRLTLEAIVAGSTPGADGNARKIVATLRTTAFGAEKLQTALQSLADALRTASNSPANPS